MPQEHLPSIGPCSRAGQFLCGTDDFLQSAIVRGVSREHAVVAARLATFLLGSLDLELFLGLQDTDHAHHLVGLVTSVCEILGAETIGLELHFTAVTAYECAAERVGQIPHGLAAGADRGGCPEDL